MVSITKDNLWSSNYKDNYFERDKTKSKDNIFQSKTIKIGIILFSICVISNTILLYSFFKMLKIL